MARSDPPPPATAMAPTLEVDGMSYPVITGALERMWMREAKGGMTTMEIGLVDSIADPSGEAVFAAGTDSPLQLGAGLRVFGGPHEVNAAELFDGQITAIEAEYRNAGPPLFTVLAEDRLFPLRRKRRTKLYEESSLGDVVTEIGDEYGLTAEVRDGVDEGVRNWMQADETDLAFLRRILELYDCDMQMVGDRLQIGRCGMDQRSLVTLAAGSTLLQARMTADISEQVNQLSIGSFDPAEGENVEHTADAGGFGPGDGKTGPEILSESFSDVAMHLGRQGPMTTADAEAVALLQSERRARSFVQVDGSAEGNAELRVGSWIELEGVNPHFAGQYAVTQAIHRWDGEHGYVTDFKAESAYLGEAA